MDLWDINVFHLFQLLYEFWFLNMCYDHKTFLTKWHILTQTKNKHGTNNKLPVYIYIFLINENEIIRYPQKCSYDNRNEIVLPHWYVTHLVLLQKTEWKEPNCGTDKQWRTFELNTTPFWLKFNINIHFDSITILTLETFWRKWLMCVELNNGSFRTRN